MIDKATHRQPQDPLRPRQAARAHFIAQRVTGALNIVFTIFFVWFVVSLAGADRAEMVEVVRNPFVGDRR